MSEQKAEPTSGEPGSVVAGPAAPNSSDAQGEPVAASMQESVDRCRTDQRRFSEAGARAGRRRAKCPRRTVQSHLQKADADKADAAKADVPRPKFQRRTRRAPRQDHDHVGRRALLEPTTTPVRRRNPNRIPECSASAGSAHLRRWWRWRRWPARSAAPWRPRASGISAATDTASVANHALEASVARLDADIQALKAGAEHASKLGMAQFNKTSERLDKVEKAQLEPAAKLAKLSEAVEKLHAAPPAASAAAAAGRREGNHRLDFASGGRAGRAQGRSGQAADGGRLVAARRRQWRRLDRRAAGNLRSLCRRPGAGSRPDRCDQAPGWPLGGRDQQRPDRRALTSRPLHRNVKRRSGRLPIAARQRLRFSAIFPNGSRCPKTP